VSDRQPNPSFSHFSIEPPPSDSGSDRQPNRSFSHLSVQSPPSDSSSSPPASLPAPRSQSDRIPNDSAVLRSIAHRTLAICRDGNYITSSGSFIDISSAVRLCVNHSIAYPPSHIFETIPLGSNRGIIEVSQETTLQACHRVLLAFPAATIAVLNFGNPAKPGGGFQNGRSAQEESLARSSALYLSLLQFNEMYRVGQADLNPLYTDYIGYSPNVPFFTDDTGVLIEPFTVSVITAAAPNARETVHPTLNRALRGTLKNRLRKVIQVAIAHENTVLILGAFGCGVFGNDSRMVAMIERELLVGEGLRFHFDFVLNPITRDRKGNGNFVNFKEILVDLIST
jgi:uncharacterized protein (TIGR02452 family)